MLEIIKREELVPNAILIALSNQGEDHDIEMAKKLGTTEYIVKANMIPSEVLDVVSKVIDKNL